MDGLKIICFTHRTASLEQVGFFHVDDNQRATRLKSIRDALGMNELMYLSTCNRVEFVFHGPDAVDTTFLQHLHHQLFPENAPITPEKLVEIAEVYEDEEAVTHLFRVAASLDSMVVGEREIITQVRQAFEQSKQLGLSGDNIRVLLRKTIETAKRIYTETDIARKPVSVVSLAYHALRDLNVHLGARVLMVGAGKTNRAMSKFLRKHGYTNFNVYNRTAERAVALAADLKGKGYGLDELKNHSGGFDVLITCTGSVDPVITPELYEHLLQGETDKKVIIDLAIPNDVQADVVKNNKVRYLEVESLQAIAAENLESRREEVQKCEAILEESIREFGFMYRERQIERAMGAIPKQIKEIRHLATTQVFERDLSQLDPNSKEILERVMDYMEKKYIGLPMKMAKEILIQNRRPVS